MSKNPLSYWADRILRIFVDEDFPSLTAFEITQILQRKYPHNAPSIKGVSTIMGQSWIFKPQTIYMVKNQQGGEYPIKKYVVRWQAPE